MAYSKFSGTYRSANHINRIHYYIFEPEADIRAIIQLTHGWRDYIERNEDFIKFFTDHGIMVCGCDFIGHGRSSEEEKRGHFDEINGWSYLVKDVKKLATYIQKEYPDVPFFLYGHGMGSLVARLCCLGDFGYDGVILAGTSGKQRFCRRSILLTGLLRRCKGFNHRSKYLENLIYKKLNRKFRKEKDCLSWYSEDPILRERFSSDERCHFTFTISAYENIFKMLGLVSTPKWYRSVNENLPVLLLGGEDDPIGDFGKGVEQVYEHLCKTNHMVEMKLYPGVRHELQSSEKNHEFFSDILDFMKIYMGE